MKTIDSTILLESIIPVHFGNFAVRIWKEESTGDLDEAENESLEDAARHLVSQEGATCISIAKGLICKMNVNAVEVRPTHESGVVRIDKPGVVVYADWP